MFGGGGVTQQLFVLQTSSSSPQVVFAEGVGAEQVAQAGRRQLLLQVVEELLGHVSGDRQTDQSRVVQLRLLEDRQVTEKTQCNQCVYVTSGTRSLYQETLTNCFSNF